MFFCGRAEDVDPENKSTVLRFHHGKKTHPFVLEHWRNYGNVTFAVFCWEGGGAGSDVSEFPSSPLTPARLFTAVPPISSRGSRIPGILL